MNFHHPKQSSSKIAKNIIILYDDHMTFVSIVNKLITTSKGYNIRKRKRIILGKLSVNYNKNFKWT